MPRVQQLTVFVLFTDGFWAATIYSSPPIESDWRWGAHRIKRHPKATFHFFQRGGIMTEPVMTDVIEAWVNGRTSSVGLSE